MTPGILAAFFLLLGQFYGPVQQLSGIVDSWQQATASGKHINALLATEETENIEPSSINTWHWRATSGGIDIPLSRKNATCA
ncbi:ATP-binding protein [Salmonella enterica subsp. enterica]|uniref:ATP-binding protein n=1 Tax=Salmonella enterica I TaxID=59201 RepID=A0A447TXA5_SALET|nr:ATP-binding protein [Salmonella enterica subsp. enterica]